MRSSGQKISKLLSAVLTGVCLAAGGMFAAESSTPNDSGKPATHLAPTHRATPHPEPKKAGTAAAGSHSPTNRIASTSSSAHHSTEKNTGQTPSAKWSQGHTSTYASQHRAYTAHNRYSRPAQPRVLSGMQRLARLHLAPERVQEIQQALIHEGYLEGGPTGEWDTRTRDSMLRYQTMHGFPPTGLPEAKSLMKLGLGPHPLPRELDHGEVGVASSAAIPTVQNVFSVSPPLPPDPPASAPNLNTAPPETK